LTSKTIIIVGIVIGMYFVHCGDIIHRDLKPANVLIDQTSHYPKIADFGVSCDASVNTTTTDGTNTRLSIAPRMDETMEMTGYVGSPLYMAPEIIIGQSYSSKVDVFSFGVLLYEIVTGKQPRQDCEDDDVCTFCAKVTAGNREKIPGYVEPFTASLISRCWDDDPHNRPTFLEIFDDLRENDFKVFRTVDSEVVEQVLPSLMAFRIDINQNSGSEYFNAVKRLRLQNYAQEQHLFTSDLVLTDTCEISVTGNSGVITGFRYSTDVVIPDKVRLGDNEIPITSIGKGAFRATPIRSVSIPGSVIVLDDESFQLCVDITEVIFLPRSSSLAFGNRAFWGCSSLKSFTLPNVTTSIGTSCFFGCHSLAVFNFEEGSTLTEISFEAFRDCRSSAKFSLPDSVQVIGDFAFTDCTSLSSIEISESSSLKKIGTDAFMKCSALKALFLPKFIEQLGGTAFRDSGIQKVEIDEGNQFLVVAEGFILNKLQTVAI
jgi:hypothetical protein